MCDLSFACAHTHFVVESLGDRILGRRGDKIVFTFYCMPCAEWLTEFVSPGSGAMEKSEGAEHRGGCRLAARELSASLPGAAFAESPEQRVQPQAAGSRCLGCQVLLNLMFYPITFPFTLLQEITSLLPGM